MFHCSSCKEQVRLRAEQRCVRMNKWMNWAESVALGLFDVRAFLAFSRFKNNLWWTDGRTNPLLEMRGRISKTVIIIAAWTNNYPQTDLRPTLAMDNYGVQLCLRPLRPIQLLVILMQGSSSESRRRLNLVIASNNRIDDRTKRAISIFNLRGKRRRRRRKVRGKEKFKVCDIKRAVPRSKSTKKQNEYVSFYSKSLCNISNTILFIINTKQ